MNLPLPEAARRSAVYSAFMLLGAPATGGTGSHTRRKSGNTRFDRIGATEADVEWALEAARLLSTVRWWAVPAKARGKKRRPTRAGACWVLTNLDRGRVDKLRANIRRLADDTGVFGQIMRPHQVPAQPLPSVSQLIKLSEEDGTLAPGTIAIDEARLACRLDGWKVLDDVVIGMEWGRGWRDPSATPRHAAQTQGSAEDKIG